MILCFLWLWCVVVLKFCDLGVSGFVILGFWDFVDFVIFGFVCFCEFGNVVSFLNLGFWCFGAVGVWYSVNLGCWCFF